MIEFDTTEYVFSHGHAPSGRGSWAFVFSVTRGPEFLPGSLTYGKAKKQARAIAKARGTTFVRVCS